MQAVRMRLFSGVVHGNDGSKNFRGWPAIERIRKFLTCPSGEQIQFISLRPFLDLPRAHQDFLVANVSGLPVATPIKLLERGPRLIIRKRLAQRRHPRRYHAPIVVESRLALPLVQLGISHTLARQAVHRIEGRPPVGATHVHQYAIYIKNQDFGVCWELLAPWCCRFPCRVGFFRHDYSFRFNEKVQAKVSPRSRTPSSRKCVWKPRRCCQIRRICYTRTTPSPLPRL